MKLHLGCGKRNFGESWTHIDRADFPHIQSHDIVKLPYPNNSVELIYASHVIEYFDRDQVLAVLKEWNRVLIPYGKLEIAVPDFEAMARLYLAGMGLEKFLGPLYGKMISGSDVIFHKTVYDFESLKRVLESCGFYWIERYDWRRTEHALEDDHSQAYIPHMEKENGVLISLNVRASKKK